MLKNNFEISACQCITQYNQPNYSLKILDRNLYFSVEVMLYGIWIKSKRLNRYYLMFISFNVHDSGTLWKQHFDKKKSSNQYFNDKLTWIKLKTKRTMF